MDILLYLAILIFSVIVHEVSHGLAALWQGDDTAYRHGRLTLNPLPHLDMMGSIVLPLVCAMAHVPVLGWAKPVPIDPSRFDHYKLGTVIVSLAGPLSNFLIACVAALIFRWSVHQPLASMGLEFLPAFLVKAIFLNLALMVFNLLPVPPLDGSKIAAVFSSAAERFLDSISAYGIFIILGLMVFGLLGRIIFPPILFLFRCLTGGAGAMVL